MGVVLSLFATDNQKAADLAAGSAVMTSSPRREFHTTDHAHASVSVTDPRRRSLTQLIFLELQTPQNYETKYLVQK